MFDLSDVHFSRYDVARKITIPERMTESLAEEIGIHVGDGSLGIYKFLTGNMWVYRISGSLEELDYYKTHVKSLLESLFNFSGKISAVAENESQIRIYSKAIATFKSNVLKLPVGSKSGTVRIPEVIISSPRCFTPFLRGIADSDFSFTFKKKHWDVHKYPVIQAAFASRALVEDLQKILLDLKFKPYTCMNVTVADGKGNPHKIHSLYLPGKNNLVKWYREIGFSSPITKTRFLVWKKFGFCPPYTTLNDRIKILSSDINPQEICPCSSAGRAAK